MLCPYAASEVVAKMKTITRGVVKEILVYEGEPVGSNDILMVVEPDGK